MVHLAAVGWLVAGVWVTRVVAAARGLPTLANLTLPAYDRTPAGSLTVVVPARNELEGIGPCLESLLGQDYAVRILAIDDRSDDGTGAVMDGYAGEFERLTKLTIERLPEGWLGKTNAMARAADLVTTDYVLFTDADILFRPDALRRALAYAEATGADHLVLGPGTIIKHWTEEAFLGLFQVFGLFAARPWKVQDPKARDAIGIGAFNLIRTAAYRELGGFGALRMEIVEDLALARRVKRFGFRQRFAYGPGLVRVHWATGVRGLVGVMTKNVFAAANYHVTLVLLGCLWLLGFCLAPFVLVFVPGFFWPSAVTVGAIAWAYVLLGRLSGTRAWNVLAAPFAAGVFIFTLLRSTVVTLRQGGVIWRGTFYALGDLRRGAGPLLGRGR